MRRGRGGWPFKKSDYVFSLFRWTIGKYEPSFASFQQQDSQELLVFLLDGLHEDLNRVTEKVIPTFFYIKQCCGSGAACFGPPGSGSISQRYGGFGSFPFLIRC
jgi:hypothetical protein